MVGRCASIGIAMPRPARARLLASARSKTLGAVSAQTFDKDLNLPGGGDGPQAAQQSSCRYDSKSVRFPVLLAPLRCRTVGLLSARRYLERRVHLPGPL